MIRRIKGDDRIILISDRSYADQPNPPGYEFVTDINFDKWGDIAGSKLTLDVACRNWMKHTGASIVDVFNFAYDMIIENNGTLDELRDAARCYLTEHLGIEI